MTGILHIGGKEINVEFLPEASFQIAKALEEELPLFERANTWEKVAAMSATYAENGLPYPEPKNDYQEAQKAKAQAEIITEVINEGWVPDYTDAAEEKWHIIWTDYVSGVGFSDSYSSDWGTITYVGARLVFKTREKAEFVAKTYSDIWNKFLTKPIK